MARSRSSRSFLIEVMALKFLHGGFAGASTAKSRVFRNAGRPDFRHLADRRGWGRPISDVWTRPARNARVTSAGDEREAAFAIDLARTGAGRFAQAWRALFGPKFPVS